MSTNRVVIGVGSNLGLPLENLRGALDQVKKVKGVSILKVSKIYESLAQVPKDAPAEWNIRFLNAAILIDSGVLEPKALLVELKKIEVQLGRSDAQTWAPRVVDLDILYWEKSHQSLRVQETELKVPHPRLCERPFALLPLLDVIPDAEIERPEWANPWRADKPFETVVAARCFWPRLVGILNLTTDSFSDGRADFNLSRVAEIASSGVEIVDLGAESTRPGAAAVPLEEEWRKLKDALALLKGTQIKISIDSHKPEIIERCLEHFEIHYINDVQGLKDKRMQHLVKISGKKTFVMHSLTVPADPQVTLPRESDPTVVLSKWWAEKVRDCVKMGISPDQLIFDPGIGFGKTKNQSLHLLKNLHEFSEVTQEIMIGHSRKSYQTLFSDRQAPERDLETALITAQLNLAFTQYLRIHDPKSQILALRL